VGVARKFLTNIDLLKNELQNAKIHVLASDPSSPSEGQIYYNSTDKTLKWYTGAAWIVVGRLDQTSAPTADVSLASHKLTNVTDPTSAQDAATKAYVDAVAAGLAWKQAVRVATTAAGTLASSFANGSTVDGVTLATNDRILIKNQAAGAENGIYIVAASGAPTRSTDADSAAEVLQAAVFVEEGTTNADSGWVLTTNAPITLNTTALTFVQFNGATVTAGAGLTLTGSTLDVVALDGSITVAADTITVGLVPVSKGGTNATDAANARSNLSVPGKYATSVGDNSSTSITVTHNLGTIDVIVQVHRVASPFDVVECDMQVTDTNTVTLLFATAPTTNQYRCVVHG
jgi:hypothetical protein